MADKKGIILDDKKVETDSFPSTIKKEPVAKSRVKDKKDKSVK